MINFNGAFGGKNFSLIWISVFRFQIFVDLRQVSVRYLTIGTGTYKNSNKGFHIFFAFWTSGFPWYVRKPRIGLLDFLIYLSINPSIILNGWRKCGITNALKNGIPSDDHFSIDTGHAHAVFMYRSHECFVSVDSLLISYKFTKRPQKLFNLFKLKRRSLWYCFADNLIELK